MRDALREFHKNEYLEIRTTFFDNNYIKEEDFYESLAWQGIKGHNPKAYESLNGDRKKELTFALNPLNDIRINQKPCK